MKFKGMQRKLRVWTAVAAMAVVPIAITAVDTSTAHAFTVVPSNYTYTTTLESTSQGVISALYQPTTPTPQSSIAIVMFHENSNLIGATQCTGFAQRGFTILCAHPVYNQLGEVDFNQVPLQIGGMVNLAWALPGVKSVVLYGWSGGGADVAYYQAVAENGVAYCQNPERLDPCSSALKNLKPASGVMSLDSIMGLAFQVASDLDPSTMPADPQGLTAGTQDQSVNMFSAANGYVGPSTENNYSSSFLSSYFSAQANREDTLVTQAQNDQQQIAAGTAGFSDDEPFALGRVAARPFQLDDALINHTSQPETLITPSNPAGILSSQVTNLNGIGVVNGDVERVTTPPAEQSPVPVSPAADGAFEGTQFNGDIGGDMTVKTFLATFAIHLDSDFNMSSTGITGVDWDSSNTSTVANYAGISVPILLMSESGHYWVVPQEMNYLAAKSTNKTLAYVWGGSHSFTPCTQCLSASSNYGDTLNETFNYMSNWLVTTFGGTVPTAPTISNIPTTATYGTSTTGLTVTTNGDGAQSITSSTASVCTVSGTTVTYVGVGSCTLTAHVAAGTVYAAADGSPQSFTVGAATPTTPSISNIPTAATFGGSFSATVATNGDGTKSVTSSTPNVCTVASDGLSVNDVDAGTCTLTAHVGVGTNYLAADGSPQSFTIGTAALLTLGSSGTDLNVSGAGNVAVTGQSIIDSSSNAAVSLSGSASFSSSGGVSSLGTCVKSGSSQCPTVSSGSMSDPYVNLAAPSTSGLTVYSGGTNQGCGVYTQPLNIGGNTATVLNPTNQPDCVYYLEAGFTAGGSASVTTASNGALLYVAAGGVSCSGAAQCNFGAITDSSSAYQGIAIDQARTDTSALASSVNVFNTNGGVIYVPGAGVSVSGAGKITASGIIASTLTDSGSAAVTIH